MLHEVLQGRHLTKVEYEHELPQLQDRLLDVQFELRKDPKRAVAVIVTGIPGAGRSEIVNELIGWLDPKFIMRAPTRHMRLGRSCRRTTSATRGCWSCAGCRNASSRRLARTRQR